jgi:hypothetical protein
VRDVAWIRRVWEDVSWRGRLHKVVWRIEGERIDPRSRGLNGQVQLRRTLIDELTGEILDDVGLDEHGRVRDFNRTATPSDVETRALDATPPTALSSRPSTTSPGDAETSRGAA